MRTIHRDIVGPFLISKDNKLLLGKSRKGGVYQDTWIIPGGGVEPGETKLQAVIRETLEETGLDITDEDIQELDIVFDGESEKDLRDTGEHVLVKMTFYNYVVRLKRSAAELNVQAADDFIVAKWFPLEELSNLTLSPPSIKTLQHLGLLQG